MSQTEPRPQRATTASSDCEAKTPNIPQPRAVEHRERAPGPSLASDTSPARERVPSLNGMRLHASDVTRLDDAVVAITDFAVADDRDWERTPSHRRPAPSRTARARCPHPRLRRARPRVDRGRAPGRVDHALNPRPGVSAGILLVREAGGLVYDLDGSDTTRARSPSLA